jgi:hypothetical protein
MNQKNVDALMALLVAEFGSDWGPMIDPLAVAQWLASSGVLVPSALTDEESERVGNWMGAEVVMGKRTLIGILEQIARGQL